MTVLACACNILYAGVTLRVGVTVDTSVKDVRDIATGAAGGTHHLRALGESGPVAARGPGQDLFQWRVPSGCHRRSIVKSARHSLPAQVVPA
jgi:hypothetical protein